MVEGKNDLVQLWITGDGSAAADVLSNSYGVRYDINRTGKSTFEAGGEGDGKASFSGFTYAFKDGNFRIKLPWKSLGSYRSRKGRRHCDRHSDTVYRRLRRHMGCFNRAKHGQKHHLSRALFLLTIRRSPFILTLRRALFLLTIRRSPFILTLRRALFLLRPYVGRRSF